MPPTNSEIWVPTGLAYSPIRLGKMNTDVLGAAATSTISMNDTRFRRVVRGNLTANTTVSMANAYDHGLGLRPTAPPAVTRSVGGTWAYPGAGSIGDEYNSPTIPENLDRTTAVYPFINAVHPVDGMGQNFMRLDYLVTVPNGAFPGYIRVVYASLGDAGPGGLWNTYCGVEVVHGPSFAYSAGSAPSLDYSSSDLSIQTKMVPLRFLGSPTNPAKIIVSCNTPAVGAPGGIILYDISLEI